MILSGLSYRYYFSTFFCYIRCPVFQLASIVPLPTAFRGLACAASADDHSLFPFSFFFLDVLVLGYTLKPGVWIALSIFALRSFTPLMPADSL